MKKELTKLARHIEKCRADILKELETLPDNNEGVTRVNKKCAIVSLSTIARNNGILCPNFYINDRAKTALIEMVKNVSPENLYASLQKIAKTGRIKHRGYIVLNRSFVRALLQKLN